MAGWGMASTGFLQVSSRAAGQVVHEAEEFRFGPDGVGEKVVVRQGPVLEYGSRVLPDRGQRAVGDHAGEVLCAVQVVWREPFAVPIDVMGDRSPVFRFRQDAGVVVYSERFDGVRDPRPRFAIGGGIDRLTPYGFTGFRIAVRLGLGGGYRHFEVP